MLNRVAADTLATCPNPPNTRIAVHYENAHEWEQASTFWLSSALNFREMSDYGNCGWALMHAARALRRGQARHDSTAWCSEDLGAQLSNGVTAKRHLRI